MMMMAPTKRLSGLQKDVLSLYRSILREAVKKDRQVLALTHGNLCSLLFSPQRTTTGYARTEFRHQCQQVKRSEFKKIEYLIRKGEKQLKILKMPGTKVVMGAS
ncbi:expressed unknown protein [Seminavis robusta]|uniref:Complex 1 LYR protein n=1 Tax=Seminavis robusta TaxID=568900 RepID=A0A9N8HVV5_9STRA|nr:expressed unknown protein [Seminavis robusta]|eukprot:Sro2064_g313120.1 n/a (104) ;mRNA; r:5997-6308